MHLSQSWHKRAYPLSAAITMYISSSRVSCDKLPLSLISLGGFIAGGTLNTRYSYNKLPTRSRTFFTSSKVVHHVFLFAIFTEEESSLSKLCTVFNTVCFKEL